MPASIINVSPFWLDERRMRALSRSVDLQLERDAVEQTTFADQGRIYVPGLRAATISATVIADILHGDSPGPPSPLDEAIRLLTVGAAGEADGAEVFAFACRTVGSSWGGGVGDALEADMSLAVEVAAGGKGLILHPDAVRSASGNGTARNYGPLEEGRRLLFGVHVFSVAGSSPQLTVSLQTDDSAAFTSPSTAASLGPAASPQGLFAVVEGPVSDSWWRVAWTISGTSPSFGFAAVIAG